MDYLSGSVSDEDLVNARIKWYRLCHLPTVERREALLLFRQIDLSFRNLLWWRDHEGLDSITTAIEKLTSRDGLGRLGMPRWPRGGLYLLALLYWARQGSCQTDTQLSAHWLPTDLNYAELSSLTSSTFINGSSSQQITGRHCSAS